MWAASGARGVTPSRKQSHPLPDTSGRRAPCPGSWPGLLQPPVALSGAVPCQGHGCCQGAASEVPSQRLPGPPALFVKPWSPDLFLRLGGARSAAPLLPAGMGRCSWGRPDRTSGECCQDAGLSGLWSSPWTWPSDRAFTGVSHLSRPCSLGRVDVSGVAHHPWKSTCSVPLLDQAPSLAWYRSHWLCPQCLCRKPWGVGVWGRPSGRRTGAGAFPESGRCE